MLRILLGVLCCVLFAEASEYIFSYRVTIANGLMLNEKYNFAPTMLNVSMLDVNPYKTCEIVHSANTEKEFLNAYKSKILECFFQWGVRLEDHSKIYNLQGESLTFLSIPPFAY